LKKRKNKNLIKTREERNEKIVRKQGRTNCRNKREEKKKKP